MDSGLISQALLALVMLDIIMFSFSNAKSLQEVTKDEAAHVPDPVGRLPRVRLHGTQRHQLHRGLLHQHHTGEHVHCRRRNGEHLGASFVFFLLHI